MPMTTRTTSGLLARMVAATGLGCTAAYLTWRVGASMDGANIIVSVLLFVLEALSALGAALLIWAIWRAPRLAPGACASSSTEQCDVVVRVDGQHHHDIIATVTAAQDLSQVGTITLIGLRGGRPDLKGLAATLHVSYAASRADDSNGLVLGSKLCKTTGFLVLDAGDIPAVHTLDVLRVHLDDPAVAAVQANSVTIGHDSLEHGPNGMHYDTFERHTLNPALAQRSTALISESGALIRRGAIESDLAIGTATDARIDAPEWLLSLALINNGWRIDTSVGEPLIVHQPIRDQRRVAERSIARSQAARALVFGSTGALRSPSLTTQQRLALLAWTVRPLSGFRRAGFVAILVACLLGGYVPFQPNSAVLLGLWLPGFVLTSLGLAMLSGWSLRPGDRTRASLRSLGDTLHSLDRSASHHGRRGSGQARQPITTPSHRHGPLGFVLAVITVAVALRAISERITGALGPLPRHTLEGLLIVTLWTLAMALDSLRLLNRGKASRRADRLASSLEATIDRASATIVDLAPLGAGVVADRPLAVGSSVVLNVTIHGPDDLLLSIPSMVRNVREAQNGRWRAGLEFVAPTFGVTKQLAQLTMLAPARSRLLGTLDAPALTNAYADGDGSRQHRPGVRIAALLTIGCIVAGAAPLSANADAPPRIITGRIATTGDGSVLGPQVTVGNVAPSSVYVVNPDDGAPPIDPAVPDSLVDTDDPSLLTPTATDQTTAGGSQTSAPQPVDLSGALVTGWCSEDIGADGVYGTGDDRYSTPVTDVTDATGTYELILDGDACWITMDPPSGFDLPTNADPQGVTMAAAVPIDVNGAGNSLSQVAVQRSAARTTADSMQGSATLADTIWSDVDGDGVKDRDEPTLTNITVTLFDANNRVLGSTSTNRTGRFAFSDLRSGFFRIGISNLPTGSVLPSGSSGVDPLTGRSGLISSTLDGSDSELRLGILARPATAESFVTESSQVGDTQSAEPGAVFQTPTADQTTRHRSTPSRSFAVIVLAMSAMLAAAVITGIRRPQAGD